MLKQEEKDYLDIELLKRNNEYVTDDEINDYIKKNIKIRNVNFVKLAAIVTIPFIIVSSTTKAIMSNVFNADRDYYYYNQFYEDKNDKKLISKDIYACDYNLDEIETNKIFYESKWIEIEDGYYRKNYYVINTKDNIDSTLYTMDLKNIEKKYGEAKKLNDEIKLYPDLTDNNDKISATYYDLDEEYSSKETKNAKLEANLITTAIGIMPSLWALYGIYSNPWEDSDIYRPLRRNKKI